MNTPTRLGGFAAMLGLAFVGAAIAGAAVGGGETPAAPPSHHDEAAAPHAAGGHAPDPVRGLAATQDGHRLEIERTRLARGPSVPLRFRVVDDGGAVVRTGFERDHERRLHLIVVRRDTAEFQHVHPRMRADGTWSVNLDLHQAGVYRVFADYRVAGTKRTLGADLFVPGAFRPRSFASQVTGTAVAGLHVRLTAPGLRAGRETRLTFAVHRNGAPFGQLQPYLGARGHLVALREGDLGYLHVHPISDGHTNEIPFAATFPTPGRYRLFVDFRTGGRVHTAAFTVEVPR